MASNLAPSSSSQPPPPPPPVDDNHSFPTHGPLQARDFGLPHDLALAQCYQDPSSSSLTSASPFSLTSGSCSNGPYMDSSSSQDLSMHVPLSAPSRFPSAQTLGPPRKSLDDLRRDLISLKAGSTRLQAARAAPSPLPSRAVPLPSIEENSDVFCQDGVTFTEDASFLTQGLDYYSPSPPSSPSSPAATRSAPAACLSPLSTTRSDSPPPPWPQPSSKGALPLPPATQPTATWANLFSTNRSRANGLSLEFIPPPSSDVGPAVSFSLEEVSSDLELWRFSLVGYVLGAK